MTSTGKVPRPLGVAQHGLTLHVPSYPWKLTLPIPRLLEKIGWELLWALQPGIHVLLITFLILGLVWICVVCDATMSSVTHSMIQSNKKCSGHRQFGSVTREC